jgi:hypothetical protein
VLGTPPAFVLSQDQTLNLKVYPQLIRIDLWLFFSLHCLVFKVQFPAALASGFIIVSNNSWFVNNFF